jgi:hypothetical protein
VLQAWREEKAGLVLRVCNDYKYLEQVAGLDEVQKQGEFDDDDFVLDEDELEASEDASGKDEGDDV